MTLDNTTPTAAPISTRAPYGGFWRRFVAYILDSLFATLPPAIICGVPMVYLFWHFASSSEESGLSILLIIALYLLWCVLGLLFTWFYFALQESGKHQSTWGKRLMGLKVVGGQGQRITFARATGRFFAKMISYFIFYIGFIMMPFTNRKRALHDIIADTYVVDSSFQQGDALPPTPSHIGWLVFLIVLFVGGYVGLISIAIAADNSLTKDQVLTATSQLHNIRQSNKMAEEFSTEDIEFMSDDEDNLFAVFQTRSGAEYLLILPAGEEQVCCLDTDAAQCSKFDIPVCD